MRKFSFIASLFAIFMLTGCVSVNLNELKKLNPFEDFNKKYTSDKDVFMMILDGSGSMNDKDRYGLVKMDAAKDIIKDISTKLDSSKTNAGLVTFANGCYSSKLLVEPSNNDFNKIVRRTQTIQASGKTPLAAAIKKTGEIMENIDKRINIVILSDGEESCGGNPVYEANRLKNIFGDRLNIFVIGYSVNSTIEYQLKQLVAGKGVYFAAQDGNKLNDILDKITDELKIKNDNWISGVYSFKINFNSGSSKVKKQYYPQIKELAAYLKNNNYKVEIQGHTDSVGKEKYNQQLSERRAASVRKEILKQGINENRVYAVGYGELAPIASNKTKNGKFQNRRVEAHIIKAGGLNVDLINNANFAKPIDVKYAEKNSFVGYYKMTDNRRTYKQYHLYIKLYANNTAYAAEFFASGNVKREDNIVWKYNNRTQKILMDWKNGGEINALIKGNTNNFNAKTIWGDGSSSNSQFTRISKEEMNCMDGKGRFVNNTCMY
jgi:outer membrane protein OmpA-like peptidoglycan-associated protein